jgi:hypothetical protein
MRAQGEAMTAAQLETLDVTGIDEVLQWRFEVLLRAGYDLEDAHTLARQREVDLHLAARLVRDGCPSGTAVRIVL